MSIGCCDGEAKMATCLSWTNVENSPLSFVERIFQTQIRPFACFGPEILTPRPQVTRFASAASREVGGICPEVCAACRRDPSHLCKLSCHRFACACHRIPQDGTQTRVKFECLRSKTNASCCFPIMSPGPACAWARRRRLAAPSPRPLLGAMAAQFEQACLPHQHAFGTWAGAQNGKAWMRPLPMVLASVRPAGPTQMSVHRCLSQRCGVRKNLRMPGPQGFTHPIIQFEGGEQGDPLMPGLFSLWLRRFVPYTRKRGINCSPARKPSHS